MSHILQSIQRAAGKGSSRSLDFVRFGGPVLTRAPPDQILELAQEVYDGVGHDCSEAAVHSGLYQKCSYKNLACYFDPQEHAERVKGRQVGQYVLEIAGEASFVLLLRVQKGAGDQEELGAYVRDAPRITRGLLARRPAAALLYFIDGRVEAVEVAAPQDKVSRTP